MKTFQDDLSIGDVIEEPNPKNPDKPILYRVIGMGVDEEGRAKIEVENIDPEDMPQRLMPWMIVSAVVSGILTYLLAT